MKIQYRVLGKPRRQRIRRIARSAWIDTDADPVSYTHLTLPTILLV